VWLSNVLTWTGVSLLGALVLLRLAVPFPGNDQRLCPRGLGRAGGAALSLTGLGLWSLGMGAFSVGVSAAAVVLCLKSHSPAWRTPWLVEPISRAALLMDLLVVGVGLAGWAGHTALESTLLKSSLLLEWLVLAVSLTVGWLQRRPSEERSSSPVTDLLDLLVLMSLLALGAVALVADLPAANSAGWMLWPNLLAVQWMLWMPAGALRVGQAHEHEPAAASLPIPSTALDDLTVIGLFQRLPVASMYLRDGRIEQLNQAFRELFDLKDGDALGADALWEAAYPDERERALVRDRLTRSIIEARSSGGRLHGFEMTFFDRAGCRRTFLLSGAWFGREALISLSETTERQQLEDLLNRQEDRLMVAAQVVNDGVWEWNCASGEVICNELYARLLGFDSMAQLPRDIGGVMALLHPDDQLLPDLDPHHDGLSDDSRHIEVRMRHQSGHYVWVLCRSRVLERAADGQAMRVVGTITDITPRKVMEGDLRRAFSQQLAVFDAAPVGICIFSEGRVLQFNRKVAEIFQVDQQLVSLDDLLGRFLADAGVLSPAPVERMQVASTFAGNVIEHHLVDASGESRWLRIYACGISDASMPHGMVVAVEDVTESRRLMREWEHAMDQALAAQRLTASLMANFRHEMNTPFNAMLGFAELITVHADGQDVRDWAEHIRASAQELRLKLQALGDMAQLHAGTVVTRQVDFAVNEMVDELLLHHGPTAMEKSLALTCVAATMDGCLRGDHDLMARAIHPVIDNALRYTHVGGVRVEMSVEGFSESSTKSLSHLLVRVHDSGKGFDLPDLQVPFLPLSRGAMACTQWPGGMGMGLALTKAITDHLGGAVTISRSGTWGSEVILRFPVELVRGVEAAREGAARMDNRLA
jgi:two-component system cell cycle sensor histidine kinase PleC